MLHEVQPEQNSQLTDAYAYSEGHTRLRTVKPGAAHYTQSNPQ